jgi:peroxiredoxin
MKKSAYFIAFTLLFLLSLVSISGYWGYKLLLAQEELVRRPDFILPDLKGKNRHNSEWNGKVVVVNFWATWCPPCIQEIPQFVNIQKKYADQGLQFVGIALDTPEHIKDFVQRVKINYPILVAEEDKVIEVANQFGDHAGMLPFTAIVDRQGNMVLQTPGEMDQATIEKIIKPLLSEKE